MNKLVLLILKEHPELKMVIDCKALDPLDHQDPIKYIFHLKDSIIADRLTVTVALKENFISINFVCI